MNGFSERDTEVTVGHLLGIRWFHLTLACPKHEHMHGDWTRYGCAAGQAVLRGAWGEWQPGENEASCKVSHNAVLYLTETGSERHEVPGRGCGCGFWAYWALGDKKVDPPSVVGVIKGYGSTIEGDRGFRCSHARIIALHLPNWDEAAALALELRYEVPVYRSLPAMLLLHRAPEGQPPLTDRFFSARRDEEYRSMWRPAFHGGGNGRQPGESYAMYGARLGFLGGAVPCTGCGTIACAPGQALCAHCQIRGAPPAPPQPKEPAAADPPGLSPADAVTQLHARRESWARAALDYGLQGLRTIRASLAAQADAADETSQAAGEDGQ